MKMRIFKPATLLALLTLAVCAVAETAWAKNPKDIVYVFGDSLSDPGNLYALTGELFPPANLYPKHTFSNGPVWAEYFTEQLEVGLEDLAYGGAFTGVIRLDDTNYSNYDSYEYSDLPADLPGVQDEVDDLLARHPKGLSPDALYVIWAGADDFFAATENPGLIDSIFAAAAKNVANTICRLSDAGARHFAVANLPDIGLTPLALNEDLSDLLTSLSVEFNARLAQALASLPGECADTLVLLDAFQLLEDVVSDPEAYGLENVTTPCMGAGADCSKYLFWDTVHPTTYGHKLFSERFRAAFCGTGSQHPGLRGRPNGQPPPIWRGACYGSK